MGLYRDDRLILIREPNGPKLDRFMKKILNALKTIGFKIEISAGTKTEVSRRPSQNEQ